MKRTSLILMAGALLLGACGGSSKGDPTTIPAVVESTVAAAPETTVADKPAEATAASTAATTAASPTSVNLAAAAADPIAALQGMLGITDPKDLDCIKTAMAATPAGAPGAAGVDPAALKAVVKCQPPQVVTLLTNQLSTTLPNAKPEQIDCVAKATLTVLAESDGDVLSALMGGGVSAATPELQQKLMEKAKPCGLSDADLKVAAGIGLTP